jgi:hypothetical protein
MSGAYSQSCACLGALQEAVASDGHMNPIQGNGIGHGTVSMLCVGLSSSHG